jgi:hypothetical protein
MKFTGVVLAAFTIASVSLVSGCGGSPAKPSPAQTAASLTIGGARSLVEGESLTLVATVSWSSGGTEVVSNGVTWVSDDPRVASVDPRGVVTALSTGQSLIRATFNSVSGTTPVRVTAAPRAVSGKVHESLPTETVVVAGAIVTAVGADGATGSAVTDASGAFTLRLVPGIAQVTVAASGYETNTTSVDVSSGDLSLALAPVLREVRETFDEIYPPPPSLIDARTFHFNAHHSGMVSAVFTQSWESASAMAHTCIEIRDADGRVLAQSRGFYDIWAGAINLAIVPGMYQVSFWSCNPYGPTPVVSMAGFGGEVKHPN